MCTLYFDLRIILLFWTNVPLIYLLFVHEMKFFLLTSTIMGKIFFKIFMPIKYEKFGSYQIHLKINNLLFVLQDHFSRNKILLTCCFFFSVKINKLLFVLQGYFSRNKMVLTCSFFFSVKIDKLLSASCHSRLVSICLTRSFL